MLGIWCGKRPRQNYKHVEDRMLSDVTEKKTFNYGLKGRVTSEILVRPHENEKRNSREFGNIKECRTC